MLSSCRFSKIQRIQSFSCSSHNLIKHRLKSNKMTFIWQNLPLKTTVRLACSIITT